MSTAVGCYVRDAGVWKRIVDCHVRNSGVWKKCVKVYTKSAGVWKVVWADDFNALGSTGLTILKIDSSSPYDVGGGWRINSVASGGTRETFATPPSGYGSYTPSSAWLLYDLGRTYQVMFDEINPSFDVKPTLGAWLNTAVTHTIQNRRQIPGLEVTEMNVSFRRNEGSPGPVLRTDSVKYTLEAGNL